LIILIIYSEVKIRGVQTEFQGENARCMLYLLVNIYI